ncbi:MAG TPA: ATP-binding protein [Solirubrobacteraceae bacterium]|nr:ATP-binding protein [Solirubrobacteraceae bacterium]
MSGEIDAPCVRLELISRPEAARLVRSMSSAAAEALGFDPELQGDINTAVAEACNNVILHAYGGAPGPMAVELEARADAVEVSIRDHGCGMRQAIPELDRLKVGLALMSALADRAEFISPPGGGTEVRLAFTSRSELSPLELSARVPVANGDDPDDDPARSTPADSGGRVLTLPGDVVLTVSPVSLLGPILGRVGRTLAPSAGFSLERCYDVYLLTDALAAHATRAAQAGAISVALGARDRRLEFALAPLRVGSGGRLEAAASDTPVDALSLLTEEIAISAVDGYETLHVSMRDRRRG